MVTSAAAAAAAPEAIPFDWHTHGLIIEFKNDAKEDPFYDTKEAIAAKRIEKHDEPSCLTRGQLAHYASELLNHQHRTHAFQILIIANFVRFLYWDRAGCIVSERIDYVENPQPLAKFLWAYNHMSPARRGWDLSASEPSAKEVALFNTKVQAFLTAMNVPKCQRRIDGAEHTLDKDYPPYKMTVGAVKTGNTQEVIVQKPFDVCRSPTGRATRAYLAYSITLDKIVFLKDSWRVVIEGLTDEDTIYFKLTTAHVPFIPDVLCAGDVFVKGVVHATKTQTKAKGDAPGCLFRCSESRTHQHHRIVQDLAYSLSTCDDSNQYTQAFRDAFTSTSGTLFPSQYILTQMYSTRGSGEGGDFAS